MLQFRQIIFQSPSYEALMQLRFNVLRKPLGLEFSPEFLEKDRENILLGAYENERLIGCVQLQKLSNKIGQLRQMAVDSDQQGKGIGRLLVEELEKIALENGIETIDLHARGYAVPFYTKLGYQTVGEAFEEVGMPHIAMTKILNANPD